MIRYDVVTVPLEFDALEPVLRGGSRLLVDRSWRSARPLQARDVVLFVLERDGERFEMFGQVWAVGGNRLERDGTLLRVDGELTGFPFPERFTDGERVPPGRVFLLNSNLDSVYPDGRSLGWVEEENIRGRMILQLVRPD